jgi:hypothetical protein
MRQLQTANVGNKPDQIFAIEIAVVIPALIRVDDADPKRKKLENAFGLQERGVKTKPRLGIALPFDVRQDAADAHASEDGSSIETSVSTLRRRRDAVPSRPCQGRGLNM